MTCLSDLDPAFLKRYDLIGPRYTSYPTAPEWTTQVGSATLCEHLEQMRSAHTPDPLSIYLHLPFCIEHCTFCACNVIISPRREAVSDPYIANLEREADLWAGQIDTRRPVIQFHWGGGTPTYLTSHQLRRTHVLIAERFQITPDAEQSIEVHPSWTSEEQLRTLTDLGFNRLSVGVQDFNPRTQEAINRPQTFEQTRDLIVQARALGFQGINCDLIYGLPYQTVETFAETIERILELGPDRLALYNFAYLPDKLAHQRKLNPRTLPRGEEKFRIFLEAWDRFVAAGYRYIGMDHFALPQDELARAFDAGTMQRNFMGFTTRVGTDLIGMGVSAISSLGPVYTQNVKKLPSYERSLNQHQFATERGLHLSSDDLLRRDVISGLMCRDHVDKRGIEIRHGIRFDDYFAEELERLQSMEHDGLVSLETNSLDLTFLGRLFVRNIAMVFDAYLKRAGHRRAFSRTL